MIFFYRTQKGCLKKLNSNSINYFSHFSLLGLNLLSYLTVDIKYVNSVTNIPLYSTQLTLFMLPQMETWICFWAQKKNRRIEKKGERKAKGKRETKREMFCSQSCRWRISKESHSIFTHKSKPCQHRGFPNHTHYTSLAQRLEQRMLLDTCLSLGVYLRSCFQLWF